jgi:hypothetical protein
MSGLSTTYANLVIDHVLGETDIGAPPTPYIGLSTADPSDDGSTINEPTINTNGYTRVACGSGQFGAAASRSSANTAAVTFPTSTGAWATGTALGYWVLFTASTGGTMIAWGTVTNPPSVAASGATPSFAIGELVVSMPTT